MKLRQCRKVEGKIKRTTNLYIEGLDLIWIDLRLVKSPPLLKLCLTSRRWNHA